MRKELSDKFYMQLELDLGPLPTIQNLFFMTSGRFANEICYTTGTNYGNASGYSHDQAINKLQRYGYSEKDAKALLLKAKRSKKWIVYNYQQSLGF